MGWIGSVRLKKIPTRLHGTNFCTTLARFARSFVRQNNGTKCTQLVRNKPKHEFRFQRGQSGSGGAKGGPAGDVAPLNGAAKHFLPLFESVNDPIQMLLTQYKLQSMVKLLIIPRKTRILHHLTYTIHKLMLVVVTVNIDRSDQSFCSLACASPGL